MKSFEIGDVVLVMIKPDKRWENNNIFREIGHVINVRDDVYLIEFQKTGKRHWFSANTLYTLEEARNFL